MLEFPKISHMPFITADGVRFCCLPVNGVWKIHVYRYGKWLRVYTGQPEDAVECAPCAECENGTWRISFVSGGSVEKERFYLYRVIAEGEIPISEDNRPDITAIVPAMSGYSRENRTVYARRDGGTVVVSGVGYIKELCLNDVKFIYRISFNPHNPQEIIISGTLLNEEVFTRIFNLISEEYRSITINGQPAYKCALFQYDCFYARQTGENFEDRTIVWGDPEFTALDPGLFTFQRADCKHAQDTGEPAFVNIPCRGNRIVCKLDDHETFAVHCRRENCKNFETFDGLP